MKTTTFILALSILSFLSYAQIPTTGLVAYYPFNGNANDVSGNAFNGTINGAVLTTDRFGNSNSAYYFDGINDYIDLSSFASSFNFQQPASISCWIKSGNDNVHVIYSMSDVTGNNATSIVIGDNTTGTLSNEIITVSHRSSSTNYYISGFTTTNRDTIFDNNWHFLVCLFDGVSIKIYLDKQLVSTSCSYGTDNGNYGNVPSPTRTYIGTRYASGLGAYFLGSIDDIIVYNRVLSSSEISALYIENQCTASMPIANDTTVCGGGIYTLYASGGTYYLWYNVPVGGSYLSIGNTFTTPVLSTNTTYYVANYDGSCESARTPVTITVNPLPNPIITGLNTGYCINANPITLAGSPTGGTFSGTGTSNGIFSPSSAGVGTSSISYSYTNPSTGCSKTVSQNVSVYNSPIVSISGLNPSFNSNDTPVTLAGTPSGGTFVGNGVSGNTFSPSIAGAGSHTVVYIYNDGNGCSNATCETTDITTSKSSIVSKENEISVYPNPNSGTFNISYSIDKSEKVTIKVINNLGEIIYSESNRKSTGNYNNTINLSSQPDGIYFIEIEIGGKYYSEIISLMKK